MYSHTSLLSVLHNVSAGSVQSTQSSEEESLSLAGAEGQTLDGLGSVGSASSDVLLGVLQASS